VRKHFVLFFFKKYFHSLSLCISLLTIQKERLSEGSIGARERERERKWQNGGGYRTAQINIRHKAVGWLLLLPASHTQTGSVAAQKEQQQRRRRSASRGTVKRKW
jgi:hypothetical protein